MNDGRLHFRVLRGPQANMPVLREGELGFTTDTHRFFIGSNAGNIEFTLAVNFIRDLTNAVTDINTRIDTEVSTINDRIDLEVVNLSTALDNHENAVTAHDVVQISNAESVSGAQAKVDAHANRTDNPHGVTTEQLNTYTKTAIDSNIATAKQEALNYTDDAISALIGGSPDLLDTLYELSNALGNDPNFSTTVLNKITAVDTKVDTHALHMNPIIAAIVFGG